MSPLPQLIVPGLDAADPLPVTESANAYVCSENDAVTERAWDMVTWHVPVPLHPSPDQPSNDHPAAAAALSVTSVPSAYLAVHVAPQESAPVSAVTVPDPAFETSSA